MKQGSPVFVQQLLHVLPTATRMKPWICKVAPLYFSRFIFRFIPELENEIGKKSILKLFKICSFFVPDLCAIKK
jgi:hypothetical protein